MQETTSRSHNHTVGGMAAPPPLYSLLPARISAAQSDMDGLVTALCRRMFPGWCWGLDHRLDRVFSRLLQRPQLQLCPLRADRVAGGPPMSSRTSSSPAPRRFSWTYPHPEKRLRRGRRSAAAWPDTGMHLSRLCRLQDPDTGGSVTTQTYVKLMYGFSN